MLFETSTKLPVETIDWGKLLPTYPYRFNGPGYLYCVECESFVRLISVSNSGFRCSNCGRVLAVSVN